MGYSHIVPALGSDARANAAAVNFQLAVLVGRRNVFSFSLCFLGPLAWKWFPAAVEFQFAGCFA